VTAGKGWHTTVGRRRSGDHPEQREERESEAKRIHPPAASRRETVVVLGNVALPTLTTALP